jgi:hypothetical protein
MSAANYLARANGPDLFQVEGVSRDTLSVIPQEVR